MDNNEFAEVFAVTSGIVGSSHHWFFDEMEEIAQTYSALKFAGSLA